MEAKSEEEEKGMTIGEFSAWLLQHMPRVKATVSAPRRGTFGIVLSGEKNGSKLVVGASASSAEEAAKHAVELWEKA